MQIESAPPKSKGLSLTPIIDVVFLLLLFFMLASTFTRFAHVEVGLGGRAASTADKQDIPLLLLSVRGNGDFAVNGQAVSLDGIQGALLDAVPEGKARIILRPSESAQAEDIIRAIEQSRATGLGPVIMVR